MLEIFQYDFMRRAFLTGILIAIITPCIGIVVVLKRLSMMGDSLSHSSLAGVAAGLVAGINPIIGAVFFSILAAFGIDKFRRSFSQYAEISQAVIMATGVGLAGVLSGFVKDSATFSSFLFGSIVAIGNFELILVMVLCAVVLLTVILLYKEIFYITFDQEAARLAGIPVGAINFIFTLLTAVTISISSRTVGTLVISSMMVLPVASALQLEKGFKQTIFYAVILAIIATISGIFISYYGGFRPGGTIVLIGVLILIAVIFYKNIAVRISMKRQISAKGY